MSKNLTHQTVDSLISQALAIEDEQAREAGALGFMARAMVQATLPHRKMEGNEFERRNGSFTLTLPSSVKNRIALWRCTAAPIGLGYDRSSKN